MKKSKLLITFSLIMLCAISCKSITSVTVTGHYGDHGVLLSNGQTMYVENAYSQAYEIGQIIIIK